MHYTIFALLALSTVAVPAAASCTLSSLAEVDSPPSGPDGAVPVLSGAVPAGYGEFFVLYRRIVLHYSAVSGATSFVVAKGGLPGQSTYDFTRIAAGTTSPAAPRLLYVLSGTELVLINATDMAFAPATLLLSSPQITSSSKIATNGTHVFISGGPCVLAVDVQRTSGFTLDPFIGDCQVPFAGILTASSTRGTAIGNVWLVMEAGTIGLAIGTTQQLLVWINPRQRIEPGPASITELTPTAGAVIGFELALMRAASCTIYWIQPVESVVQGSVADIRYSLVIPSDLGDACGPAGAPGTVIAAFQTSSTGAGDLNAIVQIPASTGTASSLRGVRYSNCGNANGTRSVTLEEILSGLSPTPTTDDSGLSSTTVIIIIAVAVVVVVVAAIGAIVAIVLTRQETTTAAGDNNTTATAASEPTAYEASTETVPRGMAPFGGSVEQSASKSVRHATFASTSSVDTVPKSAGTTVPKELQRRSTMETSVDISASKRQLNESGGTAVVSAVSRGDFARSAEHDDAELLGHRLWTDAELRRHNKRCQFVRDGAYQKGKLIGRGANGSVYGALLKDGSTIAMKEVNLMGSEDEIQEQMAEVEREMALLSMLHHDNLVTYYGVLCDRNRLAVSLFMENVTGGSLGGMARSMETPLAEVTGQIFTKQMLRGLAVLHEEGIVHRDLKCDNVLRDAHTGTVKLADFGTAKSVGNAVGASKAAQTMIGTPFFMAPEILAAGMGGSVDGGDDEEGGYGVKADIWSLGITVGELLNRGNPPWPAFPSPGHAFLHIANPESEPLLPEGLSEMAVDFIRQCTRRNPRERPTARELLEHPWILLADDDEDEDEDEGQRSTSDVGMAPAATESPIVVVDRTEPLMN